MVVGIYRGIIQLQGFLCGARRGLRNHPQQGIPTGNHPREALVGICPNKQTTKDANKQTNKQTKSEHANLQSTMQTHKHAYIQHTASFITIFKTLNQISFKKGQSSLLSLKLTCTLACWFGVGWFPIYPLQQLGVTSDPNHQPTKDFEPTC